MGGFSFIIRLILSAAVFLYFVVVWAGLPFFNPLIEMDVGVLSVFLSTAKPTGAVRDLLLVSRGLFGLTLSLYIFIPGLRFFFEFRADTYSNTICLVLVALMIAVFFGALVLHYLYYLV